MSASPQKDFFSVKVEKKYKIFVPRKRHILLYGWISSAKQLADSAAINHFDWTREKYTITNTFYIKTS